MESERVTYQAFMLRLWQEPAEAGPVWRASLESPHSGELLGFANLEALCEFLKLRIDQPVQRSQSVENSAAELGQ